MGKGFVVMLVLTWLSWAALSAILSYWLANCADDIRKTGVKDWQKYVITGCVQYTRLWWITVGYTLVLLISISVSAKNGTVSASRGSWAALFAAASLLALTSTETLAWLGASAYVIAIGYVYTVSCIILAYLAGRDPSHSMPKAMSPQPMTMAQPMSPYPLPHQPMAMEMGYNQPVSPAYQRHSGNLAPDGRMNVY